MSETKAQARNARISSTFLGQDSDGPLPFTCVLLFEREQARFGGYALTEYDKTAKRRIGTAYGLEFIVEILRTLEVASWERLPGTYCRLIGDWPHLTAIGHITKDKWFRPDELLERMNARDVAEGPHA